MATLFFVCAALLLAINLFGLTQPASHPSLFQHADNHLPASDALTALDQLPVGDDADLARQASHVMHAALVQVNWYAMDDATRHAYRTRVPWWENYLLWALNELRNPDDPVYEYTDYRRAIARGIGQCGQQSMALADFLQQRGMATAIATLNGHVVTMAEVNPGKWHTYDATYDVAIPHPVADLELDEDLVRKYYAAADADLAWQMYGGDEDVGPVNSVIYGGAEARYPTAAIVEPVSYVLKWLIPAVLLLAALLLSRRRDG